MGVAAPADCINVRGLVMSNPSANFRLEGVKELRRCFRELPDAVIAKGLKSAVGAAIQPILKSAKEKASELDQSGTLSRSLGKKVKLYSSGTAVGLVGARKGVVGSFHGKRRVPANYLHLVDRGTRAHAIPHKGFGRTASGVKQAVGRVLGRSEAHPGAKAHPFIEDAFSQEVGNAQGILEKKLGDSIEREAQKLLK